MTIPHEQLRAAVKAIKAATEGTTVEEPGVAFLWGSSGLHCGLDTDGRFHLIRTNPDGTVRLNESLEFPPRETAIIAKFWRLILYQELLDYADRIRAVADRKE